MKRILVVADCTDVAANELHATLVSNLDKRKAKNVVVEPVLCVEPFSIIHASFLSRLLAESYNPKDLIMLGVVNPLNPASHKRARLAARLKNGLHIVMPNTGVFTWLINDFGIDEIYETNHDGLRGSEFIPFGGKYIHAPIAAKLAAKGRLKDVALNKFNLKELVKVEHPKGQVVHIDNFGVAKILLKKEDINAAEGQSLTMKINGKSERKITYTTSMKERKDGTLALYPGSSMELLEIGIVRQLNAADKLHLKIGDVVTFQKR